jgi:acyl CoA:acetate/3-ketoacid CoA transferase beta subunit
LVRVVSNLAVLDFEGPDNTLRVRSLHPGVSLRDVENATSFPLTAAPDLGETRAPAEDELRILREVVDPQGLGKKELAA